MKKYKVWYKAYDNDAWIHRDGETIVEANSPEEAKEIVHGYSDFAEEYFATSVQEVEQLTHKRRQLERVAFLRFVVPCLSRHVFTILKNSIDKY